MTSRVEAAFPQIEACFLEWPSRAFTEGDIELLRAQHHEEWGLPKTTVGNRFLRQLLLHAPMHRNVIEFSRFRKVVYTWGEAPLLEVLGRMWPQAYFSHTVAAYLNGLLDSLPASIFVNSEQERASPEDAVLTQPAIDAAFKRSQRLPKQMAELDGRQIYLSNGRNTWRIGHATLPYEDRENNRVVPIRSTTLERTLIDMVVRPAHVGGPKIVLEAFRRAESRLDVPLLARMLSDLKFVYPYAQAAGFYLERSGAGSPSDVRLFSEIPKDFDFYLAHGMAQSRYLPRWRMHVPLDL